MLARHPFQDAVQPKVRWTTAQYLALDAADNVTKHEFHQGFIYAMAGGSTAHGLIESNLSDILGPCARTHGCRWMRNMRVAVAITDFYFYPDLVLVCGGLDEHPEADGTIMNPTAIIEILSPSTELIDRNEKRNAYKRFRSLTHYILISQFEKRIEILQKESPGEFGEPIILTDGELVIEGCAANLDDIYRDVTLLA